MDRISLRGLVARGHHGVLDHERVNGQVFSADVDVWLDASVAGQSDALEDTVNYDAVALIVHRHLVGEPVNLLETLGHRMCEEILLDPLIQRVAVTIHKPQAPLSVAFSDVAVTIDRPRATGKTPQLQAIGVA